MARIRLIAAGALALTVPLGLGGCAEYSLNSADKAAGGSYGSTATSPSSGGTTTAPPETEDDSFFKLPPAQTDRYVFVTNPARDTLTRVDTETLSVRTVQVGADPQIVLTTNDWTTAVVFNRADDSVSLLDVDSLDEVRVPVRDNFNQLRLSPDGAFAVLWHDVAAEQPDDPPAEGLQSFNEASFVDVAGGVHWPMAVGFNPRDVVFTPDGTLAAVVSDEYLALVDLSLTPLDARLIRLTDAVDPPQAEEVIVAPAGDVAFVRQFGATEILAVDLLAETVSPISAGTNPTDLDLSADGTELLVVARGSEELLRFDVADPFAAPLSTALPVGESFGQLELSPDGQLGVLFTTATPTNRYATWDRATDTVTLRALVKPVDKLAITPTGESLLVFHTQTDGPGIDPDSPFVGHWALTVVALSDFRTNPLLLPAEPLDFANSPDGSYGAFVMRGQRWLEKLDYVTLLHEEVPLKSDPVFVGALPDSNPADGQASMAWVSQEHDLGRISFYDPVNGSLETITGFELNSEIEE